MRFGVLSAALVVVAVFLHCAKKLNDEFRLSFVLLLAYATEVPPEHAEAALASQKIKVVTLETRSNASVLTMPGAFVKFVLNVGARLPALDNWKTRALAYRKWLGEQVAEEPERLAILTDAADVLYGGCGEEQLLASYNRTVAASGGARVVFGAEFGGWPKNFSWANYGKFQDRKEAVFRAHGFEVAPYDKFVHCGIHSNYCPSNSYEFLNAGFMMGPVSLMLKVLDLMLEELNHITNYQLAAHRVLISHPDDITLDYTGSIVLNIGHFVRSATGEVVKAQPGSPGTIYNNVLQASQCFVHGQSSTGKMHVNKLAWLLLRSGPEPSFPMMDLLWRMR